MHTKIKDLMTEDLVTISMDACLKDATELMREFEIRHLPVVDKDDGIVGILSSKDLPSFSEAKNITVEFFMTTPVIHLDASTDLRKAVLKMLENKISSLLVSDKNSEVVGILTTDDILWYVVNKLDEEKNQNPSVLQSIFTADTIGKVAYQASQAGI